MMIDARTPRVVLFVSLLLCVLRSSFFVFDFIKKCGAHVVGRLAPTSTLFSLFNKTDEKCLNSLPECLTSARGGGPVGVRTIAAAASSLLHDLDDASTRISVKSAQRINSAQRFQKCRKGGNNE